MPMPRARILLIEDEATSREILQYVLSEAGYPVDAASTAVAAHTLLDLTTYRLVIADWQLPDGDGIYIADRALALGAWTMIIRSPLRFAARHRGAPQASHEAHQPGAASGGRSDHNRRAIRRAVMTGGRVCQRRCLPLLSIMLGT
jgi:CheY-like chemotaxis protein